MLPVVEDERAHGLRGDARLAIERAIDGEEAITLDAIADVAGEVLTCRNQQPVGEFRDIQASPDGKLLTVEEWVKLKDQWLPSKADGDFIESLMAPCWETGKFASWIAAPKVGIDNKGGEFEYVKVHQA